jgi:putative toxin-antitoxin system antitoxin component (TIGR02293 family)
MLTAEDKEDIRGIVTQAVAQSGSRVDGIVEITASAIEVLGAKEKALHWLKTPVRSLDGRTPLSLLDEPGGIERVEDALGRIEHGVW